MEPSSAYQAGEAIGWAAVMIAIAVALFGGGGFFIFALIRAATRKTSGWILAAVLAGVVALAGGIGGIGLAAAGFSTAVKKSMAKAETKTRLTAENGAYGIQVPGSWEKLAELNPDAGIVAGHKRREQYVLIIENPRSDYAGDLASFDDLSTSMLGENLRGFKSSDPEVRKVGGYPSRHRRITGICNNLQIVYHAASVETADGFYQILAWTLPSRETAALPVLREVIDSFHATAGVPAAAPAERLERLERLE